MCRLKGLKYKIRTFMGFWYHASMIISLGLVILPSYAKRNVKLVHCQKIAFIYSEVVCEYVTDRFLCINKPKLETTLRAQHLQDGCDL